MSQSPDARHIDYTKMAEHVRRHPYRLIFATISGAHLYGFPSPDSDFDLRGAHVLPLETIAGLDDVDNTVEKEGIYDGLEIDLVTHDVAKFFSLMLKRNGYVLEQVFSPLVVFSTPEHDELKSIAAQCVTRHHAHHYLGFAATQWKLFLKDDAPRVKPLLYVYRVLLTGIHLMQTGKIEADLVALKEHANLNFLDELLDRKRFGPKKGTLDSADLKFHSERYNILVKELETARDRSQLRESTSAKPALNDLLVRIRLRSKDL